MQEKVGRYSIRNRLGQGGMGSVYLASDPVLNRQVAIKMVDLAVAEANERVFLRERLLRDAKAAALLSHPNIVSVFDVIEDGGNAFVVMEYVPGETLAGYLDRIPIPDAAFSIAVLRQIASALDYTHSKGIIHRDIKPANVMRTPDGVAKILDFGIARISEGRTTSTGVVMGTVEYMSPEQVKGEPLDGRSDQFSLASIAYRMLTGSTVFGQQTMATLAYKLVAEMPPPPTSRNRSLPAGIDKVMNRALAKLPSERFASCADFVEALNDVFLRPATQTIDLAALQAAIKDRPATPVRRMPAWLAAAAGVVVLAGGLALWQPWSPAPAVQKPAAKPPVSDTPQTASPAASQPPAPPASPNPAPLPPKTGRAMETPKNGNPSPAAGNSAAAQKSPASVKPPVSVPRKPAPPVDTERLADLFSHGQEQLKQRDFEGAVQSFTTAIAVSPDYEKAYFSRGLAREFSGQCDPAIEDYTQALKLNPQDVFAHIRRGVCLVRTRQDDLALVDFNRALELNPGLPAPLNGRGGIHFRRREFAEAIRDFDAALRLNPRFAQAYANRARARRALGNLTGAEDDMKKFEELKGETN